MNCLNVKQKSKSSTNTWWLLPFGTFGMKEAKDFEGGRKKSVDSVWEDIQAITGFWTSRSSLLKNYSSSSIAKDFWVLPSSPLLSSASCIWLRYFNEAGLKGLLWNVFLAKISFCIFFHIVSLPKNLPWIVWIARDVWMIFMPKLNLNFIICF